MFFSTKFALLVAILFQIYLRVEPGPISSVHEAKEGVVATNSVESVTNGVRDETLQGERYPLTSQDYIGFGILQFMIILGDMGQAVMDRFTSFTNAVVSFMDGGRESFRSWWGRLREQTEAVRPPPTRIHDFNPKSNAWGHRWHMSK